MVAPALRESDLIGYDDLTRRVGLAAVAGLDADTQQRLCDAIQSSSDLIAAFCNRTLIYTKNISELLPGDGTLHLVVSRPPIYAIASVSFDGTALVATDYECLGEDLLAGVITVLAGVKWTAGMLVGVARNGVAGSERRRWTVVYSGGFLGPNQASVAPDTPTTLPPAIKRAAISAAVFFFLNDSTDFTLTSERLQSYGYTRAGAELGDSGLPMAVEKMLSAYHFPAQA